MPVVVHTHTLTDHSADYFTDYFANVTREDPDIAAQLNDACSRPAQFVLYEAHFNGKPIGFALVETDHSQLHSLIIHPATRRRGVGTLLLEQTRSQFERHFAGRTLTLPAHCNPR